MGGPLKIKGGMPFPVGVKKKKKKDKGDAGGSSALVRADSAEEQAKPDAKEDIKAITRGQKIEQPSEQEDRRTEAEKRFEQAQIELEKKRLAKMAGKSHRDRVKEFNDYLANLSVRTAILSVVYHCTVSTAARQGT